MNFCRLYVCAQTGLIGMTGMPKVGCHWDGSGMFLVPDMGLERIIL